MLKLCLSLLATPAAAQFIMGAFLYFLNVLFCCCWGLLRDCPRGSRPTSPHDDDDALQLGGGRGRGLRGRTTTPLPHWPLRGLYHG